MTGQIFGGGDTDGVEFSWTGNDEMEKADGDGLAERQPDGTLVGEICFYGGDKANFIDRRKTSSAASQAVRGNH